MQGEKRKVLMVGSYRFTGKLLGKGNFARVEEAVHNVLNVKVAVKIMDINKIKEDYVLKNLYREAKLMAKLNHPNITSLFETMQKSDNVYYLVTELVSGGDLCTFIKGQRHGKLEERSTRVYARQFVSALAHMHSLGIVHRDLKMENVMLNSLQTQIKIVDFGLSNSWTANRPLRTHCGSPEYAAPELFVTGREYGAEVDLWSLGIILYGMVIGQLPFVSSKSEHISSQERRKRLVAQINKGLSGQHQRTMAGCSVDFRSLMNRLLVADASQRITIKELLLHPWITENGTKLVRTGPIKPIEVQEQAKVQRIINNISSLLHVEVDSILNALKSRPFGKIAGIYNILLFKHNVNGLNLQLDRLNSARHAMELAQLNENVVEKVGPSTAPAKTRNPPFSLHIRQLVEKLEKSTNGKLVKNHVAENSARHYKNTINECNKLHEENNGRQNEKLAINQNVDYRSIKSPSLRRKAYSATIPTTKSKSQAASEKTRIMCHQNQSTDMETNKKPTIIMTLTARNAEKTTDMPVNLPRRPASSALTKLDKCAPPRKRQINYGPPQHTAERILKRNSSAPTNYSNNISKSITVTKEKVEGKIGRQMIVSTQACGDGIPFESSKNMKRKFIQDPIARSIAGYVVNNIPDTFKWYRN